MDPKEMKNEDLEKVTGGVTPHVHVERDTRMVCSNCGHETIWAGEFVNKTFECPRCHENTFKGEKLV